jgi:hypothetical protein
MILHGQAWGNGEVMTLIFQNYYQDLPTSKEKKSSLLTFQAAVSTLNLF